MYSNDNRIVMTLDAGGSNLVFSAIRGGDEIVTPITLPSCAASPRNNAWDNWQQVLPVSASNYRNHRSLSASLFPVRQTIRQVSSVTCRISLLSGEVWR